MTLRTRTRSPRQLRIRWHASPPRRVPIRRLPPRPLHRALLRLPERVEFDEEDRLFHCWAAFLATLGVE